MSQEMFDSQRSQEEELMKQALEMSLKLEEEKQQQIQQEEDELLKRVMEISEREERDR